MIYLEADGRILIAKPSLEVLDSYEKFQVFNRCVTSAGLRLDHARMANVGSVGFTPFLISMLEGAKLPYTMSPKIQEVWNRLREMRREIMQLAKGDHYQLIAGRMAKMGKTPYAFQREDSMRMASQVLGINSTPMGGGKTVEALLAAPSKCPMLVICPATAKYVWAQQADLLAGRDVWVLEGRDSWRWPRANEIVVISYACMPKTLLGGIQPYTRVFLDEMHYVKTPDSLRTKRCAPLVPLSLSVGGGLWGLTGSPADKAMDIWNLIQFLCSEQAVFGDHPEASTAWEGFVKLYNGRQVQIPVPPMTLKSGKKIPGRRMTQWEFPTVTEHAPAVLARIMIRRRKEDILPDLPPKIYHTISVNYKDLFKGRTKELKAIIEALNRLVPNVSKMTHEQLLNEFGNKKPSFIEYSQLSAILAEAKIPVLLSTLDDFEEMGEPVIVFSAHHAPVLAAGKRKGWGVIDGSVSARKRKDLEEQFESGKLKGLACTMAGKEALTLIRADHMIFVSRSWAEADNSQAEDRSHRIGRASNRPLNIHDIVGDHPLEVNQVQALRRKAALNRNAIDSVALATPLNWEDERVAWSFRG